MEKIKVLVKGPILTLSGYAEHARFIMRSLKRREDIFDIYAITTPWGQCRWLSEPDEERAWFDSTFKKTMEYMGKKGMFDLFINNVIPPEFETLAPINIGVTSGIETNIDPPRWNQSCNKMDKIIVESEHAKNSLQSNFPIDIVSFPAKQVSPVGIDINLEPDFNFLVMAQAISRKNVDTVIAAFLNEFRNENVGLVLKLSAATDSLLQKERLMANLTSMSNRANPRSCKVYLIYGYLSDAELAGVFTHPKVKAFVTATKGEAFYLPMFDAVCNGLPVIAPPWSGYVDYMTMPVEKNGKMKNKFMGAKIDYVLDKIRQEDIWQGVYEKDQIWAYCTVDAVKIKMREVYKNYSVYKSQAEHLQAHVLKEFSVERQYAEFVESVLNAMPSRMENSNANNEVK